MQYIKKLLIESFRSRLELLIYMNGESISALLSCDMKHPKAGMITQHRWDLFSEEEDDELIDLYQ